MLCVLVVPTYQEAGHIERVLREVRTQMPEMQIVVCDDNSPDGTGAIADRVAAELGNIEVLHRRSKDGLGAAYRHGFAHALELGAEGVFQMDVDFSHDPTLLKEMRNGLEAGHDAVVGSRYVPGGSTPDWPLRRRLLSKYGNDYARLLLGLSMKDATSGFRAYTAEVLRRIEVGNTQSNGYGFMIETGYLLTRADADVLEVPIVFRDRVVGDSKMSVRIMAETMFRVTRWGLLRRFGRSEA